MCHRILYFSCYKMRTQKIILLFIYQLPLPLQNSWLGYLQTDTHLDRTSKYWWKMRILKWLLEICSIKSKEVFTEDLCLIMQGSIWKIMANNTKDNLSFGDISMLIFNLFKVHIKNELTCLISICITCYQCIIIFENIPTMSYYSSRINDSI